MRRILPFLLILCLLLCACSGSAEETLPSTEASTAPTQASTKPSETKAPAKEETEPDTELLFQNPVNGEGLEEPFDGRLLAGTIDNVPGALPHHGVSQADVFFEMLVNDYCTRGLALFSDVTEVESIGPIRSARYNFTDLGLAYDFVLNYGSASPAVLQDLYNSGVDQIAIDEGNFGYRDNDRYKKQGYLWEHTLFAEGQSLAEGAQKRGFSLTLADKDYGMLFAEDGTPADGQDASEIEIVFTLYGHTKTTVMKYDADTGKYVFWQYGKEMIDENNDEPEAFRNVIVILAPVKNNDVYHVADLYGSGDGYYACGGKLVPIRWIHENETDPFTFTLADGTPLVQGVGSSYVAIAPQESPVTVS